LGRECPNIHFIGDLELRHFNTASISSQITDFAVECVIGSDAAKSSAMHSPVERLSGEGKIKLLWLKR
jgi:hypothetical protein